MSHFCIKTLFRSFIMQLKKLYLVLPAYFVVEPEKRLEYNHGANENQKALFRVNV